MLVKIKYRLFAILTIFFFGAGIMACKDLFKDPSKSKDTGDKVTLLLLDRNFINTKINIRLVDINGQQLSTTEPVQVQFFGNDASNLITFGGKKRTTYSTSSGYVEVGYDPNIGVSSQDPIELTVLASNDNYVSVPQSLKYTSEGTRDVIITMYAKPTLKSAKLNGFNEPFDLTFNSQPQSSNFVFIADVSSSPTGTSYVYKNLYIPSVNGNIVCSNLKDAVKYSDYGVYYQKNGSGVMPVANPVKNANLQSGAFVYTAVQPSGVAQCDKGLKIHVSASNGSSGSGVFDYKLTFSDNTTKSGKISCDFPSDIQIEQIFYPSANPSVKVELLGDGQYGVSPAVTLSSACDGTANFTLTSKSGLKTYKLVTRYSCPDSNVGLGLTTPCDFRLKGSTDAWTTFQFQGGVCTILLTAGKEYEFRFNIDGKYYTYILPTDPNEVRSFLQNTQSPDFSFRNLEITNTETLVTISCDVQFSQMVCDQMDTGLN